MPSDHLDGQNLSDIYSLALSAPQTRLRILDNDHLFSKSKENHLLELTRTDSDTFQGPTILNFTNSSQLSAYFGSNAHDLSRHRPSMEIYSIHQQDTWAPLSVSRDMISLLMNHYGLSSGFLQILACFRDRYLSTEEALSGTSQSRFLANRPEFGWVYKYSEKKQVTYGNPWRIRHTGIYHVLDRERAKSILFIISPSPTAQFKTYFQKILQQSQFRSKILASPMLVHSMLISTHLASWQEYLEYHETLLLKLDMKSACTSLGQPLVEFDTLKEIRAVERNILPVEPLLRSFNGLIDELQEANGVFSNANDANDSPYTMIQAALNELRKESASYGIQASYIHKRTQSTAQSVLDSLNLGFQQLAQSHSRNTFIMARSAREDSVAIRAITLVTSFYLPFSFVATMFGMNLVDFDSSSRNLLVSNQFWLYFVISVPLTATTLAYWRWQTKTYREGHLIEETRSVGDAKSVKSTSNIEMV